MGRMGGRQDNVQKVILAGLTQQREETNTCGPLPSIDMPGHTHERTHTVTIIISSKGRVESLHSKTCAVKKHWLHKN